MLAEYLGDWDGESFMPRSLSSIWAVQENSTPTIKKGEEENEQEEDREENKGKNNPARKQKT